MTMQHVTQRRGGWLAGILIAASIFCGPAGTFGDGFLPDEDGWIHHWVVYGPIAVLPGDTVHDEDGYQMLHPVTGIPLIAYDLIAESTDRFPRRTEANFHPAPGKEIATRFEVVLPTHALHAAGGRGINPFGRPMGIPWESCSCTVDFDRVFNLPTAENDNAGASDIGNYVAYAYTYVENLNETPLDVLISYGSDDASEVLLGKVPEQRGTDFLEPKYLFNVKGRFQETACVEGLGPDPQTLQPDAGLFGGGDDFRHQEINDPVTLHPGLNLLLVKVFETEERHAFRFRFRHNRPADMWPPLTGDDIRIHLYPDLETPDPALFLRMDTDQSGTIEVTDALATLGALFSGSTLRCPDAADADDNGGVDLTDPVYTLNHLFLGGPRAPFPRSTADDGGCCGFDPTWDELVECDSKPTACD